MGRNPSKKMDGYGFTKGAWTPAEDNILTNYVNKYGERKWTNVAKLTGLKRCGKSCRLRWLNYLRPDIKRGNISQDEEQLIIRLHKLLGNRWSLIAGRLPGRTDNEIKNYWNTNLAKKAAADQTQQISVKPRKIRANLPDVLPPISESEMVKETTKTFPGAAFFAKPDQENELPGKIKHEKELPPPSWDDLMMDFNIEEFCNMLDSDLPKFNNDHGELA